MKNISLAMLLTAFVSVPAVAGDMYLGGKLGSTTYDYLPVFSNKAGFGLLAGYTISGGFSAEVEFTDLGGFETSNKTYKGDVWSVRGVYARGFGDKFSMDVKLGLASTVLKATNRIYYNPSSASYRTLGLSVGFGGKYNVTPAVGIRLGLDFYVADSPDDWDINAGRVGVLGLGGVFKF